MNVSGPSSVAADRNQAGKPAEAARAPATADVRSKEEVRQQLDQLRAQDQRVHSHNRLQRAMAGPHARPVAQISHTWGPDGRPYAVRGTVDFDLVPEMDPAATLQKAQTIARAAMAPADRSVDDLVVAARASAMAASARAELLAKQLEGHGKPADKQTTEAGTPSTETGKPSLDAYA